MATVVWIGLTVLTVGLLVLAFALYATVGADTLNTPHAFAHDGPRDNRPAPRFELETTSGARIAVPLGAPTVLLFTDHSLIDFPELLGLLAADRPADDPDVADLPAVLLVARSATTTPEVLAGLELRVSGGVVPQRVYDQYRIRVMPYAVVVDGQGVVRGSALVNTAYNLRRLVYRSGLAQGQLPHSVGERSA